MRYTDSLYFGPRHLPLSQHVLDVAVVLGEHEFGNLLLSQPLEVLQTLYVGGQVSLSSHDTTLYEECLLAEPLLASCGVGLGVSEVVDVVANRVIANHPGVHVHTSRLFQGTFSGLCRRSISTPEWPYARFQSLLTTRRDSPVSTGELGSFQYPSLVWTRR